MAMLNFFFASSKSMPLRTTGGRDSSLNLPLAVNLPLTVDLSLPSQSPMMRWSRHLTASRSTARYV